MTTIKMHAHLGNPCGLFLSNGEVYFADQSNHRVRKILRNGQIVTIAGTGVEGYNGDEQMATEAHLNNPTSVVVSSNHFVYISEQVGNGSSGSGHRIRKILRDGTITTIAGTGIQGYNGDNQLAIHAQLCYPSGLFVTDDEEILFADQGNNRVRKIDRRGVISTIAGSGYFGYNGDGHMATETNLKGPKSVVMMGNDVYFSDCFNNRIVRVLPNGKIETVCGMKHVDGPSSTMNTCFPFSIAVSNGEIYLTDRYNHQIRKYNLLDASSKIIAGTDIHGWNGDGLLATDAQLHFPEGIFLDHSLIYFCDEYNRRIRVIDGDGRIRTIAGTGQKGYSGDVPFDIKKYPHVGPRKKQWIKPFVKYYYDVVIKCDSG